MYLSFHRQNKDTNKVDGIGTLSIRKHNDVQMRKLSNPFNVTPTSQSLLKFRIENTTYLPNTAIKIKNIDKVGGYLEVDLLGIAKPKNRYKSMNMENSVNYKK